jgi:PAS domain S-box-containing protein
VRPGVRQNHASNNREIRTLLNELEQLRQQIDHLGKENDRLRGAWQQSREQFYRIFHSAANPLIIARENDWVILDANEAFAAFTGYKREELIGRTMANCGLWEKIDQRDTASRMLQSQRKLSNLEVLVRTKEGNTRTAFFSGSIITVNDESCVCIEAGDIPAQKNVEETLKKSEEKYRKLVEESMQGLAIIQD